MTPENMVAALCKATDMYGLSNLDLSRLMGITPRRAAIWREGKLSLQETSIWAEALGYTLRFEKKNHAV